MKKLTAFFTVFLFLIFTGTTYASSKIANDSIITVPANEVVDGNFYAAGEIVEISGKINGDAYVFGGQIIISGEITGDLIAAGGTINVSGSVGQDARIAGGQINITGPIAETLSVAGGTIDILNTSSIGGAAQVAGGNITISAPITDELLLGAGSVTLNNQIGGDIDAGVGNLRLSSNANIQGNLNYWSEQEASIDQNATVSGQTQMHQVNTNVEQPTQEDITNFFKGVDIYSKLSSIIASIIIGFILLKLFPNYSQKAAEVFTTRFARSLGYGFLGIILIPMIFLMIVITLIGIPFALMSFPVFILYLFIARVYAMLAMGNFLTKKANMKSSNASSFAFGIIAYYVLTSLPFIGGLIKIVIILAAFGAAMINDRATHSACHKARLV